MMGLGFTLALVALGATRELLGSGTLFANAELLLGFLLAGKRILDRRLNARRSAAQTAAIASAEAV
jgi:Na+-translocating ferredoxin:NAD+ oxidoreductase RnfE subunit